MKLTSRFASLLLLAGLFSFAFCGVARALQEPEISVAGLAIAKEDPDSEYGGSMVPGLQAGTTVYLQARLPDRTVIALQQIEDRAMQISDSTGKQLPDSGTDFGFMSDISEDGKTIRLPISSGEIPATGATAIEVKGAVMLYCGEDSKTDEMEVALAVGQTLKVADIDFEITGIEDSYISDEGQMFEWQSKTSPSRIQQIQAVMADGKTVELESAGSTEFGFGDDVTYGRGYNVPGQVADIRKLKVTWFQNVKEVELPFEISVGLGF
jgi:hypothetical protein